MCYLKRWRRRSLSHGDQRTFERAIGMNNKPTNMDIAIKFSRLLINHLGCEKMLNIIASNYREADKTLCHTHSHCDANSLMVEAIESFDGIAAFHLEDEQHITLFNEAWTLAKKNNFFLPQIQYNVWNQDVLAEVTNQVVKEEEDVVFHDRINVIVEKIKKTQAERQRRLSEGGGRGWDYTIPYKRLVDQLVALVTAWKDTELRHALMSDPYVEPCILCGRVCRCGSIDGRQTCISCLDQLYGDDERNAS